MTRGGIREYAEAVRGRYLKASRKEKGKILDEFTQVTGYHRKAAIRLFHRRAPNGRGSDGASGGATDRRWGRRCVRSGRQAIGSVPSVSSRLPANW